MTDSEMRRKIKEVLRKNQSVTESGGLDLNETSVTDSLLSLFSETVLEVIDTPIREGDATENDEIIPDGIREAMVRQEQRAKLNKIINE